MLQYSTQSWLFTTEFFSSLSQTDDSKNQDDKQKFHIDRCRLFFL